MLQLKCKYLAKCLLLQTGLQKTRLVLNSVKLLSVFAPVLEPQTQEGYSVVAGPEEYHQDYQRAEAPSLGGQIWVSLA